MPTLRIYRSTLGHSVTHLDAASAKKLIEPYENDLRGFDFLKDGRFEIDAFRVAVLGAAHRFPPALQTDLGLLDQLDGDDSHAQLAAGLQERGITPPLSATTLELAVLALREYRELVLQLVATRAADVIRSFDCFNAGPLAATTPAGSVDAKGHLQAFLNGRMRHMHVGGGVQLFQQPYADGFRIIIRRAGVMHRQGAVDLSTGSRSEIMFRPEKIDVLWYDEGRRRLYMNVASKTHASIYAAGFGLCYFGNEFLFSMKSRLINFDALVKHPHSQLPNLRVPHLRSVRLKQFTHGLVWGDRERTTVANDDVLHKLRQLAQERGTLLDIESALLLFTFVDGSTCHCHLSDCRHVRVTSDRHIHAIISWCNEFGLLVQGGDTNVERGAVTLAV
ncbi:MAG TPA: hypothetical protein VK157_03210 [Phycisphaerales bacterium]|nr:hypothetical protein [Phycisphaerales bacterium]